MAAAAAAAAALLKFAVVMAAVGARAQLPECDHMTLQSTRLPAAATGRVCTAARAKHFDAFGGTDELSCGGVAAVHDGGERLRADRAGAGRGRRARRVLRLALRGTAVRGCADDVTGITSS